MADYIYLLQHRLTAVQRRALEAVRDAARGRGMPVFLVGGAVRDLTSGAPVRDLDFAVQGDAATLAAALETAGARQAGENRVFLSRYYVFPGGVRVEVGPTLTATFPQAGVAEVQPAPILDDLRRRDFTVNAMAISLNEGSYGLLLDPLNGVGDFENHELRLVSNLGFIEQPALLLRAARLSHRLGWNLEERTQRRYENAKEEGAIERLSAEGRGYELEEIFHEEDPVSALEHLGAENWLAQLSPVPGSLKVDQEGLDRVRDTLGQMEQMGIFADPSPVYFPFLTGKLPAGQIAEIKAAFARPGFAEQIDSMEARSRELASQLTSKAAALPSAAWKLLFGAEPEVVLSLASSARTGAAQAKFKAFFTEWPQARQRIPHTLLQEMRITPDLADYDRLIEDLFFAIMDNKLTTPEETRAFLEPFSPPAPAQQATPRRRAAKSARGRGRPAAVAVALEDTESADRDGVELDRDEDDGAREGTSIGTSDDEVEPEEERTSHGTGAKVGRQVEAIDSEDDVHSDGEDSGGSGDVARAVTALAPQANTPAKKGGRATGVAAAAPVGTPAEAVKLAPAPLPVVAKQPAKAGPVTKSAVKGAAGAKGAVKAKAKVEPEAAAKHAGAKKGPAVAAKIPAKAAVAAGRKAGPGGGPVKPAATSSKSAGKSVPAKSGPAKSPAVKVVPRKTGAAKTVVGKTVAAKSVAAAKGIAVKKPVAVKAAAKKAAPVEARAAAGRKRPAKGSKPVPSKRSSR